MRKADKMKILKRSCISLAILLALGVFSGNALAEEVKVEAINSENKIEEIEYDVIEAKEMLAGDELSEFELDESIDFLQTNALFTPRLTGPEKRTASTAGNPYYYEKNIYYLGGYGMPNCTAYAYGRAYEILGTKPSLSTGNANQWWGNNLSRGAYSYGDTPKLGSIICWGGSNYGHVAVVEKIEGNKVTYSESTWTTKIHFRTGQYTIGNEDHTSVGGFQGYIYLGDFDLEASKEEIIEEEIIEEEIIDTTPPLIANLKITDVDDSGFTVSCNVEDQDSGIDRVVFPIWTAANGQDDIKWHTANISAGLASKRISYKDHNNERGLYVVHAYAYDRAGLSTMAATEVKAKIIDITKPTISKLEISNVDETGFTVSCEVYDQDSGIDRVVFPIWTAVNGQDDLIWYQANVVGNIASKRISYKDHKNERDDYSIHVYAYDKAGLFEVVGTTIKVPERLIKASYKTHVQNMGWEQEYRINGETSGTHGKSLRLEGIEILADNQGYDLGISYSTHIQNIGWQDYKKDGQMSGTEGQGLRLEAIRVKLTGADAKHFDVYYRVHAQNIGWLDWAKNGQDSGTAGFGYRLEAIEIKVIPNGVAPPGQTVRAYIQGV